MQHDGSCAVTAGRVAMRLAARTDRRAPRASCAARLHHARHPRRQRVTTNTLSAEILFGFSCLSGSGWRNALAGTECDLEHISILICICSPSMHLIAPPESRESFIEHLLLVSGTR
jgi:hypothetical protein